MQISFMKSKSWKTPDVGKFLWNTDPGMYKMQVIFMNCSLGNIPKSKQF